MLKRVVFVLVLIMVVPTIVCAGPRAIRDVSFGESRKEVEEKLSDFQEVGESHVRQEYLVYFEKVELKISFSFDYSTDDLKLYSMRIKTPRRKEKEGNWVRIWQDYIILESIVIKAYNTELIRINESGELAERKWDMYDGYANGRIGRLKMLRPEEGYIRSELTVSDFSGGDADYVKGDSSNKYIKWFR